MDLCRNPFWDFLNQWQPLPPEERRQAESLFKPRRLVKNEFFLSAGEQQKSVGFNLKGVFRYFYVDYEGRECNKHFVLENEWVVSLTAFIDSAPALFSIQALEAADILSAPADAVRHLLVDSPYWQTLYKRLLETNYVLKERREAQFLMNDAKGRYLAFLDAYPSLSERIRQHHIASFLGMTSVSLSRIRSMLTRQ